MPSKLSSERPLSNSTRRFTSSENRCGVGALYLDELSYREMAEVLGISESNVGVKLNRAKKALSELMNGDTHMEPDKFQQAWQAQSSADACHGRCRLAAQRSAALTNEISGRGSSGEIFVK